MIKIFRRSPDRQTTSTGAPGTAGAFAGVGEAVQEKLFQKAVEGINNLEAMVSLAPIYRQRDKY